MNKAKIRVVVELEVETPLDPTTNIVKAGAVESIRAAVARAHDIGFDHELPDTTMTPTSIGVEWETPSVFRSSGPFRQ